jgi:hypothetical protein
MVFRRASAIATLLIGLSGQALAQYYPPAQAYPPQVYSPPQGHPTRQPLPSVADGADDAPPINAPVVQGPSLPPIGVGPQWNGPPAGTRYRRGTPVYPADTAPPPAGGQPYRSVQPPDGYELPVGGTRPYYAVPGAIPPGPAGSAKQDAILQEAMRSPLSISPGRDQMTQIWVDRCKVIHAAWPDLRPTCGPRLALCNHRKTMSQRVPKRVLTTASLVPFPPAQPVLPNRMQSCGRRCSRGCRSGPVKSIRVETIRV